MTQRLATAFAAVVRDYELGRPEYPGEAIELVVGELGLAGGARVLDLAAGTGKLTRPLRAAGMHVIAVEPLAEMRARLVADEVLAGTAEDVPLPDASVRAVVVGDAWHWFDAHAAADELARVLVPGGGAAVLSQKPAPEEVPEWMESLGEILAPVTVDHPVFREHLGRDALERHRAFDGLRETVIPYTWRPTHEQYISYARSWSFVARLPAGERDELMARIAEVVPHELELPFACRVWTTRRA